MNKKTSDRKLVADAGRNAGWLFLDKVVRTGLATLFFILLARWCGPEDFGKISFAQALISIFLFVAGLGIRSLVVRELVIDQSNANVILGGVLILHLVASVLCYLTIAFLVAFTLPNQVLTQSLVLIFGLAVFTKLSDISIYWFESCTDAKYFVLPQCLVAIVFFVPKCFLIFLDFGLQEIAWALIFELYCSAIVMTLVLHFKGINLSTIRFNFERVIAITREGWPLFFSAAGIIINLKVDQVMLGWISPTTELGIYAAAVKLSEAWYLVVPIIVSSIFPTIVKMAGTGDSRTGLYWSRLYGALFWLSLFVCLGLSVLSSQIIEIVFGKKYDEASGILLIHVWAGIAVAVGTVWSRWMLVENKQSRTVYNHAISASSNVLFNLLLIPQFGGVGAAIATLLSSYISLIIGIFLHKPLSTLNLIVVGTTDLSLISNLRDHLREHTAITQFSTREKKIDRDKR